MGRAERKRWQGNDRATELIAIAESRALTFDEILELRKAYTGYGGLHSMTWGQFFTPEIVAQFMVRMLEPAPDATVFEPSCGAGIFFSALPETCDIYGVEMMHEAYKVSCAAYPHVKMRQGNTLTTLREVEGMFDLVIGNPPFSDIPSGEDYSDFTIAKQGKNRAEWYFLELGMRALKPGGFLAYVVPDGILGNSKDLPLRKWLFEQGYVRSVISLPSETFKMSGTGVKTSVLVVQKKYPGHDPGNYEVFMAISKDIGWDSRGRITGKCDLPQILEAWQNFRFEREWMFTPGSMLLNPAEVVLPAEMLASVVDGLPGYWHQLELFS